MPWHKNSIDSSATVLGAKRTSANEAIVEQKWCGPTRVDNLHACQHGPTSPSASAATAAVSLGHLQRTHLSESLWVAFLVEPATSRVIEALAKFTAVAVEIAKLCVSHVGRMRLYTNGIGGGEGACRRSWRPCELLPEIICATLWEGSGMAARSLPEKGVIISVLTFPPSPIHQS